MNVFPTRKVPFSVNLFFFLFAVIIFFSRQGISGAETKKINVFVSIPPEAGIVEAIGGEYVKVSILLPPGRTPHTFEPSPGLVASLTKSDIYFTIGFPFEKVIVDKILSQESKINVVDISMGIKRRQLIEETHNDFPPRIHSSKENFDPHVWLSPANIKIMADNVYKTFIRFRPRLKDKFKENKSRYLGELNKVDKKIKMKLAPLRGRTFFVFHPAFGYFADYYGLKQKAIEVHGKSPAPRYLVKLIKQARKEKVKIIFAEPQFDSSSARIIASAIHGTVVKLDPLAKNILKNLNIIADKIANLNI